MVLFLQEFGINANTTAAEQRKASRPYYNTFSLALCLACSVEFFVFCLHDGICAKPENRRNIPNLYMAHVVFASVL